MLIELSTANSLFEVSLWTKWFTKSRGSFITTFWRRRRQWSHSMTAKNFTSQLWTPVLRVPFQMFCRMLLLRWEDWSAAQNGKYAKLEGQNCNGYLRICEAARMGVESPCNKSTCFDILFAVFESKENFNKWPRMPGDYLIELSILSSTITNVENTSIQNARWEKSMRR